MTVLLLGGECSHFASGSCSPDISQARPRQAQQV